ncbi:hypothetical protein [Streptomyces sp. NPDC048606]|uniref:hypothetical protein n=1 Tax=Streptomyces sp. NPDC048606 TaxID=3154726 RepID=UPI0034211CAB
MNSSGNVDHDAVLRARTTLLGSGTLSPLDEIEAYRVLADVSPLTYRPKLVRALMRRGGAPEFWHRPDVRLALYGRAADAARDLDTAYGQREVLLFEALDRLQRELFAADRHEEARAVRAESVESGWEGFTRGREPHGRLAVVLAEEGRHADAAGLWGREVDAAPSARWPALAATAALEAAGRHAEALETFAAFVDAGRRARDTAEAAATTATGAAATSATASATIDLVHRLAYLSRMSEHHADPCQARAARAEALTLLGTIAEGAREQPPTGGDPAFWAALFAMSAADREPRATPDAAGPAFGETPSAWSHHVRRAYFDGVPALEAAVAAAGSPAERLAAQRRSTAAVTLRHVHGDRPVIELAPLFDEGVRLARDLPEAADRETATATALTDRALFHLAGGRPGPAHADLREVVGPER